LRSEGTLQDLRNERVQIHRIYRCIQRLDQKLIGSRLRDGEAIGDL
jgi:hypothetical protein